MPHISPREAAEDLQRQRKIAKLTAALELAEEYFDGRADVVDGDYGEPAPNREMSILSEIREALGTSSAAV